MNARSPSKFFENVLILLALAVPAGAVAAPLAATISGNTLSDASSAPLPGINVYAYRLRQPKGDFVTAAQATSASGGAFTLTVGPGQYVIFARAPNGDYADEYWKEDAITEIIELDGSTSYVNLGRQNTYDELGATVIDIDTAEDSFSGVKIYLAAAGHLWGCLKNPESVTIVPTNNGAGYNYSYSAANALFLPADSQSLRCMAKERNSHHHHIAPIVPDDNSATGGGPTGHRCFADVPLFSGGSGTESNGGCPGSVLPCTSTYDADAPGNCGGNNNYSFCNSIGSNTKCAPWWQSGVDKRNIRNRYDGQPACTSHCDVCTGGGTTASGTKPGPYRRHTPAPLCSLKGLPPGNYDVLVYDTRGKFKPAFLATNRAVTAGVGVRLTADYTTPAAPTTSSLNVHSGDGGTTLVRYGGESPVDDNINNAVNLADGSTNPTENCCVGLPADPASAFEYKVPCPAGDNVPSNCTALTPGSKGGSDVDNYRIRVVAGQRYIISTTSPFTFLGSATWPLVDTFLGVRLAPGSASPGQILAYDDDSAGNKLSRLEVSFPDSTDYIVSVTTSGDPLFVGANQTGAPWAGEYGIKIERLPSPPSMTFRASFDNDLTMFPVTDWIRLRAGEHQLRLHVHAIDPDRSPNADTWELDENLQYVERLQILNKAEWIGRGAEWCAPRAPGDPCAPPDYEAVHGSTELFGIFAWAPPAGAETASPYYVDFQMRSNGGIINRRIAILVDGSNHAPGQPAIAFPENGATLTTTTPVIKATATTDPDGDALVYYFQLEEVGGANVQRSSAVVPGPSAVEWSPPGPLLEDHEYRVKVWASDGYARGADSAWVNFKVSVTNGAPGPVRITSPGQGDKLTTVRPPIEVSKAVDPENDPMTYRFEIHTSPIPSADTLFTHQDGVPMNSGAVTVWAPNVDLEHGKNYCARARAIDRFNNAGPWSAVVCFDILTPSSPECTENCAPLPPGTPTPPPYDEPVQTIEALADVPEGCQCGSAQGATAEVAFLAMAMLLGLRLLRRRAPVAVRRGHSVVE